jgi:type II secretory pathway component PulF
MMKTENLIENAKGWNLIGNGLQCGMTLGESLALVEEGCQSAELKPLFRALIQACEACQGARPEKTAKYDLIPDVVFELVYIGWVSGMLDRTLSLASAWLRAQLVYENDAVFLSRITDSVLAVCGSDRPISLSGDPGEILNDCLQQLNLKCPIPESSDGAKFRKLAVQIGSGANPDALVDREALSSLEKAFYLAGYNSGTLDTTLRKLADVIDFNQQADFSHRS